MKIDIEKANKGTRLVKILKCFRKEFEGTVVKVYNEYANGIDFITKNGCVFVENGNYERKTELSKLIEDFSNIETPTDLKRRRLTLCDYKTICGILTELKQHGRSEFIQEDIKRYFEKFLITCNAVGIGWEIAL